MTRPLIAVTDSVFPSLDQAMAALKRLDPEIRIAKSADKADILDVARDADGVLVTYAKLPGELLRELQRCKVIGRFGLGVDNIDIKAAAALNITVTYVPDYCLREVSDHAMALVLALARKVPFSNSLTQQGRWEMPAVVPIRRLDGQILGLIGLGNIPRLVVPKAKAFGFKVVAHDPFVSAAKAEELGVALVSFERLLEISDFISVHAPLTPQTRGLFNTARFKRMKPTAVFVNTARGPIVNEADLIEALKTGTIFAAGLDVTDPEPPPPDSPLLRLPNLVVAPHIASATVGTRNAMAEICAYNLIAGLTGQPLPAWVNPEVSGRRRA